MMKVAVVGAITIDITRQNDRIIGGPPWYAGAAIRVLGGEALLYSAVGEHFPESFFQKLVAAGFNASNVVKVEGARTHAFKPVFKDGARLLRLVSEGPSLPQKLIDNVNADAVIVSPVFKEVGVEHVRQLRSRTRVLAVDLQGFLRQVDSESNILLRAFPANEILTEADVVHCSAEEALALTGCEDVFDAATALSQLAVKTCLIGVDNGLLIIGPSRLSFIEIVERAPTNDSTGAGDILTGAFTVMFAAGLPPEEAGAKALEVVARSLANPPPDRVPPSLQLTCQLCRVAWQKPRV